MIDNIKFKPSIGVDVGTSFIVSCRQTEDGKFFNKFHRNMLYPLEITEESADLLERSNYLYVKSNGKFYVVGDDALRLSATMGGQVVRPMASGTLNPSLSESSDLLFFIIKAVIGEPIIDQECLRFSCPSSAIDVNMDNLFHKMVLTSFFTKIGFSSRFINEGICICYDFNPKMKLDNEEVPFTGISISCGAGQWNVALSLKGLSLVEFSCTKSGDYIDEQVERATGVSKSKIIRIKEKELDLDNIDENDRVKVALSIYYDETISRMIYLISNKFKEKASQMEGPIDIVFAGGTSMVKGFINRVKKEIEKSDLPFKVNRVLHSPTPFYSVAQGACLRAQADYARQSIK